MLDKLEKILMPLAEAIGRNKYLISIRDGFLVSTPLLIAGSLFLLIANFPVPGWPEFLESIEMGNGMTLATFLSKPSDATFTIMAIFATMGIAYSYAKQIDTDRIFGAATALMSWFLLMPYVVDGTVTSVALYAWVKRRGWVIKMPAGVPPTVVESFSALIPIMVTMGVFFLINTVFGMFGTDVFDIIFVWLQTPLLGLGDTLGAMVIAYVFLHLFWFFGINGSSVVGAVFNPILQTLAVENLEFFKTGIGEGHIICQQFQDLFATFGGAGSTLSLIIAMLLFCKSKRIKQLGKLALVPGIFNINEPVIFGLPIVMNPLMLIPFMLVPTVNIVVSYLAMAAGFVPICNGIQIPWTMPLGISGFFATNWVGALLQIALLVLGVFLYMPFIKMMDKQYLSDEQKAIETPIEEDDIDLDDLSFDDL